jgi:uncharacterized RmlC-like cupin family protein
MSGPDADLAHSPAGEHPAADPTPGMERRRALDTGTMWSGTVRTEPGVTSAWHHHGEHDSTIYVADGILRLEFGPGGRSTIEARPGDFVHVPAGAVHRETNHGDRISLLVVVRCGTGEPTVNLQGPAPG